MTTPEPVTMMMTPEPPLQRLVEGYIHDHHFHMFPVVEEDRLSGCVTLQDVRRYPTPKWRRRCVRELLRPSSPENAISIDRESAQVLWRISRLEGQAHDNEGRRPAPRGGRIIEGSASIHYPEAGRDHQSRH